MKQPHAEGFTGTTDSYILCITKLDEPSECRYDFVDTRDRDAPRFAMVHVDTPDDGGGPRVISEGPYDERQYEEMSGQAIRLVSLDDLEAINPDLSDIEMRVGINHPLSFDEIAGRLASIILA